MGFSITLVDIHIINTNDLIFVFTFHFKANQNKMLYIIKDKSGKKQFFLSFYYLSLLLWKPECKISKYLEPEITLSI